MLYFIFLLIILILLILFIFFINKNTINTIKKCIANEDYIDANINKSTSTLKRKTTKMVAKNISRYKLLQEKKFFIPSMMNGSYCDINYSTYYVIPKFMNNKKNINDNIKIRVRHYYFSPGLFFEIKIKDKNIKIRTEIDHGYNIITSDSTVNEYYPLLERLLKMLKKNKLKFLCTTKYKRFSYFYFNDNNIRITLDTDIEYNEKKIPNLNILEIKYPIEYINSIVINEIINKCSSFDFKVSEISKSNIKSYDK
jgi:hypothetical protein